MPTSLSRSKTIIVMQAGLVFARANNIVSYDYLQFNVRGPAIPGVRHLLGCGV